MNLPSTICMSGRFIPMNWETVVYKSDVRPPVQTHVECMIDYLVRFLLSDVSPERSHSILTNQYCTPIIPGPFIFFNIEQMTYPKMLKEVCDRVKQSDIVEVWDYSQANVDILKSQGIQARHVPLQTTPEDIAKLKSYIPSKPHYDVGFCGMAPLRRTGILDQIVKHGLIVAFCNTTYGEDRDRILANCRVQLNIHQTDVHKVYESTRCNHWLDTGVPVISETSLDDDPRCMNVPYDALVDTVVKFCKTQK